LAPTRPCFPNVLGDGVYEDGQIFQVSAGESHTNCLALSGKVYSSGAFRNTEGAKFPIAPDGQFVVPISLPGPVVSIHSGANFSAAILEDGSLYTWGKSTIFASIDLFDAALTFGFFL
jgi:alpha-tubulin suppressor-like RCC1 family protein